MFYLNSTKEGVNIVLAKVVIRKRNHQVISGKNRDLLEWFGEGNPRTGSVLDLRREFSPNGSYIPQLSVSFWDFTVLISVSFLQPASFSFFSATSPSLFHLHMGRGMVPPFKFFPIKLPPKSLTWVLMLQFQPPKREYDWLSLSHVFNPGPISCARSKVVQVVPSAGVDETTH